MEIPAKSTPKNTTMETLKFKTNIKCSGCVATVTPFLDEDQSIENWQVDLQSPERMLKVETSRSPKEIAELMKKAGYTAEEIAS
jgi:copper chaperone